MQPKDRIIVALDVSDLDQLKKLVEQLHDQVGLFKIGLEAITKFGAPQVVETVHQLGGKVFYDGKFCDIPNTVKAATQAAIDLGVYALNVHASCGIKAMQQAVQASETAKLLQESTFIWAVTVLTSLEENQAHLIFGAPSKAKVLQLARDADSACCDGIICSPQELKLLRQQLELQELEFITPGIRPKWAASNDQQRITTPEQAIEDGADYLVIGRPITQPPEEMGSPVEAAKRIAEEISQAGRGE